MYILKYIQQSMKARLGFTLAEVLITLGIIGVVAALTIPTLMNQTNNKEIITALKKAHSELSQAYILAEQENATPDTWGLASAGGDAAGATVMINMLLPYLKINKNCPGDTSCFAKTIYRNLDDATWFDNTTPVTDASSIILSDGSLVESYNYGRCTVSRGNGPQLNNICGEYFIDVNGAKKPNKLGVDVFLFYLTTYGIFPVGTAQETGSFSFAACSGHLNGRACTAWALYNENLDYTKCPNTLSWSGPTTCN